MRVLEKPKAEPVQPKDPGAWRLRRVQVGAVVEHRGHVWRKTVVGAADQWTTAWVYVSPYDEWTVTRIEQAVAERRERARMPKRGPKGPAGDSGASRT